MADVFIMNEERYKQVEIEVQQMDEDKTVLFLVPEKNEAQYVSEIEDLLWACRFTVEDVMAEMKENGKNIFYMCTMYDDRIEHEYTDKKDLKKETSLDEKMVGAKAKISAGLFAITKITKEQANLIINYMDICGKSKNPHLSESGFDFLNESGKYYFEERGKFVGFDYYADYEGFVEEFEDLKECKAWLRNEFEIGDIDKWRAAQEGKNKSREELEK